MTTKIYTVHSRDEVVRPQPPSIRGYLTKLKRKQTLFGSWAERYFQVNEDLERVEYFKLQAQAVDSSYSTGFIDLWNISSVRNCEGLTFQVISGDRSMLLKASSEEDRTMWVSALTDFLEKRLEYEAYVSSPKLDGVHHGSDTKSSYQESAVPRDYGDDHSYSGDSDRKRDRGIGVIYENERGRRSRMYSDSYETEERHHSRQSRERRHQEQEIDYNDDEDHYSRNRRLRGYSDTTYSCEQDETGRHSRNKGSSRHDCTDRDYNDQDCTERVYKNREYNDRDHTARSNHSRDDYSEDKQRDYSLTRRFSRQGSKVSDMS